MARIIILQLRSYLAIGWQHDLETPVASAGLAGLAGLGTPVASAGLAGLRETKSKDAVMTDAEREERIRAEERARVLREQEEKARQEKLDNTLASLSTGLEEFRSGLSQLRTASEAIEQRLAATSEELSALKGEAKPVDLEPIKEGLAGIRAMIPENFCEKFPEICTLLERPAEAKGPEHETAKEFLECSECSPSFAEAASGTGANTLIAKRGKRVRAFLLRISSTPVTAWQLRLLY